MYNKKFYFTDSREEYFEAFFLEDSQELQPGKKRPAMVVCPGGGYTFLSDREAEPIVMKFLAEGYQVFLLHYKCLSGKGDEIDVLPTAVQQLAMTMAAIRKNADEWFVNPDKVGVIGFSAGAHLVACLCGQWQRRWLAEAIGAKSENLKPNAAVLMYPVIDWDIEYDMMKKFGPTWNEMETAVDDIAMAMAGTKCLHEIELKENICDGTNLYLPATYVSENNPPTFLSHAADDLFVYVENSLEYARKLAEFRVPFEMHIFEKGGHGFSLANEVTSNDASQENEQVAVWVQQVMKWLRKHMPY